MSDAKRFSDPKPREKTLSRSAEERAREQRDFTPKPSLAMEPDLKDTRASTLHRHQTVASSSAGGDSKSQGQPHQQYNAISLEGQGGKLTQTSSVDEGMATSLVVSPSLRDVLQVLSEMREEQRQLRQLLTVHCQQKLAQDEASRQTTAQLEALQKEFHKQTELIARLVEADRSSSLPKKEKASSKKHAKESTREDFYQRQVEPPRRVCYVYRTKSAQGSNSQFEREIETLLNELPPAKSSGGLFGFWSKSESSWTVRSWISGRRVPSNSPILVLTYAEGMRVDEEELSEAFAELSANDCTPLLIATLRYGDRSQPALLPESWRKPGGRDLLCLNFAFGRNGLVDHLTKESIVQLANLLNSGHYN